MMERRNLVGSGLLASAAALLTPAPAASAQRSDDEAVASAIADLQKTVERGLAVSPELARIRDQQRTFLKANQKFPDFIDIGVGVWENLYDWHVRHQQPLNVGRTADGRYVMTVMFTTLILRPEQDNNYVSFGFDAR
jgi:hypothetical protein